MDKKTEEMFYYRLSVETENGRKLKEILSMIK